MQFSLLFSFHPVYNLVFISLCVLLLQTCSAPEPDRQGSSVQVDTLTNRQAVLPDHPLGLSLDELSLEQVDNAFLLSWSMLAQVEFEYRFNEELQGEIAYPVFSDTLKLLDGEWVQVEGYVIPLEETGDEAFTILSAFPYAQCFFCGNAGPESVIDVQPQKPLRRLKTDDKVRFRGRLRLNDSDLDYLNYILEDAALVE